MESLTVERMPIACVHCAKAKAKCDKKVIPIHQLVHHNLLPSSHTQRNRPFNLLDMPTGSVSQTSITHRHTCGFTQTPPDLTIPVTPLMPNMPQMDAFVPVSATPYDHDGDNQFLAMNSAHGALMDFDPSSVLTDFTSPPSIFQDARDQFGGTSKGLESPNQMHAQGFEDSTGAKFGFENGSPSFHVFSRPSTGSSPTNSSFSGLQEPDAVIASHDSWPFFQCNRVEKYSLYPPKTAHLYLEGLAQTLRNQATWKAWSIQVDERSLDIKSERKILTEPIVGWSREKLLAITQLFLHKALDIHKNDGAGRDESPASPDSSRDAFLMLPPPDVMQYFLRSYAVRYEPYYSSVPGGRLDPNALMHSSNSKAASLLVLLMTASGASATPTPEARYIASGFTEACRLSLFDTIEKDVMQSRDVLVLRAALLFICLAAWSGDKWHMDMSMGQRGTYLAMVSHAGLLERSDSYFDLEDCRREPQRAWEEWKDVESKHRLAYSWVTVDQEISLFSDTTPLLSVVDLHAPMPDNDDLWHAESAGEWLELFEKTHGSTYSSPSSLRDFFSKFVDGDFTGKTLSPTQLRLLLHPLQTEVCHLRQFIACLPEGNKQSKASRAVSRAATKVRLEELSALLQQWYFIIRQSFSGNKGTCWTTCSNLILYHLISLNVITSFRCIEQFARREVILGPFRHQAWLQNRCIDNLEESFFHCGQILRLIRSMPKPVRPPWWAGAVYRVALTAWATSMTGNTTRFGGAASPTNVDRPFAIDDLTPENETISRYLKYQEGTPMLTRQDGSLAPLDVPANVLQHCIDVLEDDSSMRLADGIKRKLSVFMISWKDN
ncbi:hypothetical protein DV738_g1792, partial [Chaetothyriales sp. CBS 135597]